MKDLLNLGELEIGPEQEANDREQILQFMHSIDFRWSECNGFNQEHNMLPQLEKYISKWNEYLGISPNDVMQEMKQAQILARGCATILGVADQSSQEGDNYLPYHGYTHAAENSLYGGVKLFLPKLVRYYRTHPEKINEAKVEEQKYWLKVVTKTLVLHELKEWWIASLSQGLSDAEKDKKIAEVGNLIISNLDGINRKDLNAMLMLDNYNDPVELMLVRAKSNRKQVLIENNYDEGDARIEGNRDDELFVLAGEAVVGADFFQVVNKGYWEKRELRDEEGSFWRMKGSLILALEMYLLKPQYIPDEWISVKNGKRYLDLRKVGPEPKFVKKVIEKIWGAWRDLIEFDPIEAGNAWDFWNKFLLAAKAQFA